MRPILGCPELTWVVCTTIPQLQEIECHNVPFFSGSNPMYLWHNRLLARKNNKFCWEPPCNKLYRCTLYTGKGKFYCICFEKKSECWKTVHKKTLCSMYEKTDRHCLDHICCIWFKICRRKDNWQYLYYCKLTLCIDIFAFSFKFLYTVIVYTKLEFCTNLVTFRTSWIQFWVG